MSNNISRGSVFKKAIKDNNPLQVVGTINAYTSILAEKSGHKAIYLSGGGVAASSLGVPDLGITTLQDVLIDVERITNSSELPLLVDADTGWGGAFNISRMVKSMISVGAAAIHIEDQVAQKRCGHSTEFDSRGLHCVCLNWLLCFCNYGELQFSDVDSLCWSCLLVD